MSLIKRSSYLLIVFAMLYSCQKVDHIHGKDKNEKAEVITQWYRFIAHLQLPSNPQPVVILNMRNFAFVGVGLYEAVQPGMKKSFSLSNVLYQMPAMPAATGKSKDYLWSASANAALASMFKLLLTGLTDANKVSIDSLEAANNQRFRAVVSEEVITRSQAFGRSIATAIYDWSKTDNFNLSSVGYTPPIFPGAWVPTSAAPTVGAFLQNSRPFLAFSLTALAPPIPVAYSTAPGSGFYAAAKEVYDVGKALSEEQKAIARWWADAGGVNVGVPSPYHLLSIVTSVIEKQAADFWKTAETYAKVGIAQKDGGIITFRSKYHYNLIRPVTYIQQNIDASYQAFLPTPPYPEYTSGLIGFYGPVMHILIREFGDIPVVDDAYAFRGLPVRSYPSISELLKEAARSRVYGGLHYQFTQDVSVTEGKILADRICNLTNVKPNYYHP